MQINGLSGAQAAQSLSSVGRNQAGGKAAPASAPQSSLPADQLDLSPEAQALSETQAASQTSQAAGSDGIRWDRVNELRQAIADGNFETSERISGALDNILDAYA